MTIIRNSWGHHAEPELDSERQDPILTRTAYSHNVLYLALIQGTITVMFYSLVLIVSVAAFQLCSLLLLCIVPWIVQNNVGIAVYEDVSKEHAALLLPRGWKGTLSGLPFDYYESRNFYPQLTLEEYLLFLPPCKTWFYIFHFHILPNMFHWYFSNNDYKDILHVRIICIHYIEILRNFQ